MIEKLFGFPVVEAEELLPGEKEDIILGDLSFYMEVKNDEEENLREEKLGDIERNG